MRDSFSSTAGEVQQFSDEQCNADETLCVSPTQIGMSILISQPVHFIFDIIFVITASIHVHDIQDLARSTLKCGLQWVPRSEKQGSNRKQRGPDCLVTEPMSSECASAPIAGS